MVVATWHDVLENKHAWAVAQGDARETMAAMPPGCVHLILTSPPFWALRMYETGVWEGGSDPQCDHRRRNEKQIISSTLTNPRNGCGNENEPWAAGTCPYCGARRIEQTVWGGDPSCDHAWGDPMPEHHKGQVAQTKWITNSSIAEGQNGATGNICQCCGAWRGGLGNNPVHDCLSWARGEPPCSSCYTCGLRTIAGGQERPDGLWRILRDDGVCLINLGDSYVGTGSKNGWRDPKWGDGRNGQDTAINRVVPGLRAKNMAGIPWRAALAFQADGWILRCVITWQKLNALPGSQTDRPTLANEWWLMLVKSDRYFWDADATRLPHTTEAKRRAMRGSSAENKYASGRHLPPGVHANTMSQARERQGYDRMDEAIASGETHLHYAGRNRRTTDWWFESAKAMAREVALIARAGGLLTDDDEPLAVVSSIGGDPRWDYCLACHTFFAGDDRRRIKVIREQRDGADHLRRICPCGCEDRWTDHYATFPFDMIMPFLKSGTSAYGCCSACGSPYQRIITAGNPSKGKNTGQDLSGGAARTSNAQTSNGLHRDPGGVYSTRQGHGWRPSCICGSPPGVKPDDWELIASPLSLDDEDDDDQSVVTGRAGYNRPRAEDEGRRLITRYEQRHIAAQLASSPHRPDMEAEAGSESFAHYLRTDKGGARPVPDALLTSWIERGWLTAVMLPDYDPPPVVPCVVFDPFAGSGTTMLAARRIGRRTIGCELSESYAHVIHARMQADNAMEAYLSADGDATEEAAQLDLFAPATSSDEATDTTARLVL